MEGTAEWVFRIVIVASVLGLFLWAIKGWWAEKTVHRKPGDQMITLNELEEWHEKEKRFLKPADLTGALEKVALNCHECIKDCNTRRNLERDKEMNRLSDMFSLQLQQGEKRFASMEEAQKDTAKALQAISTNLALLTQTVARALKNEEINIIDPNR